MDDPSYPAATVWHNWHSHSSAATAAANMTKWMGEQLRQGTQQKPAIQQRRRIPRALRRKPFSCSTVLLASVLGSPVIQESQTKTQVQYYGVSRQISGHDSVVPSAIHIHIIRNDVWNNNWAVNYAMVNWHSVNFSIGMGNPAVVWLFWIALLIPALETLWVEIAIVWFICSVVLNKWITYLLYVEIS